MADTPIPGASQDPLITRLPAARHPSDSAFADAAVPDLPSEESRRAPGQGAGAARTEPTETGPAIRRQTDLQTAAMRAELATLSSALAAHGDRLRDAERSLVDRIADVDDDRRLTAAQLQRAWQTHREEADAARRRRGRLTALAMGLLGAVVVGVLFLLYQHERGAREALAGEVQELRGELTRFSGIRTQDVLVQDKLAGLSGAVGGLSAALAELAERDSLSQDPGALAERIARLEAGQRRLAEALASVPAGSTASSAAGPDIGEPVPISEPEPKTETAPAIEPEIPPSSPGAAAPPAEGAPPSLVDASSATTAEAAIAVADRPYALQLIGFYNRDELLAMAARPGFPRQVYERRETLRGRPWFVLIHSLHPSYLDAQAEIARLPPELAALKPWIRQLPPDSSLGLLEVGGGQ